MTIRINKINIKGLGPLPEFSMDPRNVNLIYGHNERGKTYLVEFLIHSLFKKTDMFSLRSTSGRGEVIVTGIEDKALSFNPEKRGRKLEDCLPDSNGALPPNLARLLVVRAGDLAMAKKENGGVDRAVIKEYLSNEGFLESIQKGISKTIQSAELKPDGTISGASRGELAIRDATGKALDDLDKVFNRLQEVYSGGNRARIQNELDKVRTGKIRLDRARRHDAWILDEKKKELEAQLAKYPPIEVNTLQREMDQFKDKRINRATKENQAREKEAATVHYPWLIEAIDQYKSYAGQAAAAPGPLFIILAAMALLAAVLFSFLEIPAGTLVSALAAAGFGFYHLSLTRALFGKAVEIKERDEIAVEFTKRFRVRFSGLAGMEEIRKKLEPEALGARLFWGEIEKISIELDDLKKNINARVGILNGTNIEESGWEIALEKINTRVNSLNEQIRNVLREFDRLNIDPSNFLEEDPGIKFDQGEYGRLLWEESRLDGELQQEINALNDLKAEIARQVGVSISTEWEELITKMKDKYDDSSRQYREITANISAGILVNQELKTLRELENQGLANGLQSAMVCEPLKRITGRYEHLTLEGDTLQVSDPFGSFALADLSTGAQEQVLLALRIGFARKIMGHDSLFLILDDAFQHSDWDRRVRLVDEMVSLSRQGWQILYFTMDDHIRDLFDSRVKPALGKDYQSCFLDY